MSTLGDDLIQAMTETLAHAKGEGPAIVHASGAGSARKSPPDASSDGPADGHEPVRLPEMGTGTAPRPAASSDPAASNPERTGRGEARIAVVKRCYPTAPPSLKPSSAR